MSPLQEKKQALVVPVLLVLAGFLSLRSLALALAWRVPLQFVHGLWFWIGIAGLLVSLAAIVVQFPKLWRAAAKGEVRPGAGPLRGLFVAAVTGWLLFLAFAQPFQSLHLQLALGFCAGGFAMGLLLVRRLRRSHPRGLRALDLLAFSLCAAALVLELGLRAWNSYSPSPLFSRVSAGPGELVQRYRCAPGEVRFGFPCNSRGYYDGEFYAKAARAQAPLWAVVGDSFCVGAVPHAFHFTTLCEELLGAEIYNLGVAGIGPPEYAYLVAEEVAALEPDQIVLALFVGNDLTISAELGPRASLRRWFQAEEVFLFLLPRRLTRIARERERRGGLPVAAVQGQNEGQGATSREAAAAAFPWLLDPSLEQASLSEPTFLDLEVQRALELCAHEPVSMDLAYAALLEARAAAGPVPFAVLLIPDEFQVEDDLWHQIEQRAGRTLQRDLPQKLLGVWLAEQGIDYLDLLPVLRAVPELDDGQRHVYHLRDTHLNARGNRAVAEALAPFLSR